MIGLYEYYKNKQRPRIQVSMGWAIDQKKVILGVNHPFKLPECDDEQNIFSHRCDAAIFASM